MWRLAPVGLGVALGLTAILLAWCVRPLPAPTSAGSSPTGASIPGVSRSAAPAGADLAWLRRRSLVIPVAGLEARDLSDTFADARVGHSHDAIDLLAPRGTRVIAADDGTVVKLSNSGSGGLSVYQLDPSSTYCYYYAHLDRYALRLHEGLLVRKGETLGYVGASGNASWRAPHLHFAVYRLGPDKLPGHGIAVNPYEIWAHRD